MFINTAFLPHSLQGTSRSGRVEQACSIIKVCVCTMSRSWSVIISTTRIAWVGSAMRGSSPFTTPSTPSWSACIRACPLQHRDGRPNRRGGGLGCRGFGESPGGMNVSNTVNFGALVSGSRVETRIRNSSRKTTFGSTNSLQSVVESSRT